MKTPSARRARTAKSTTGRRGWLWTAVDWLCGRRNPLPVPPPSGARLLKTFPDGSRVEFDAGSIDAWCVYVTRPPQARRAPRDTEYFTTLLQLHAPFPRLRDDFIEVFSRTTRRIDSVLLTSISEIATRYPSSVRLEVDMLLTTLYATMVAEENRAHAPLGKRLKRLAVHQILHEGMPVAEAANFSRGQPWRELEKLCVARGF